MFLKPSLCLTGLLCFAMIFCTGNLSVAQENQGLSFGASVDRNRIVLGEPFILTLQLQYPANTKPASFPDFPDSIAHFELIEKGKADTSISNGNYIVRQRYRLTSFDSGHWVIPAFILTAGKKEIKSDSLGMDIQLVPLEGNEYNDIRDIIEVEDIPFDWKRWSAIGLSILILAIGLWYYLKNRKKPKPVADEFASKLGPFDQALQSLQKLREDHAMQQVEVKKLYSGIYDTLRIYLQRHFKLQVMSDTTGDVLLKLKGDYLDPDSLARLAEVLRIADAVKFARYPSSAQESSGSIEQMENVIRTLNQIKR